MKKLVKATALVALLATLTACTGARGYVGNQPFCENHYLLGVISISELIAPCKK